MSWKDIVLGGLCLGGGKWRGDNVRGDNVRGDYVLEPTNWKKCGNKLELTFVCVFHLIDISSIFAYHRL